MCKPKRLEERVKTMVKNSDTLMFRDAESAVEVTRILCTAKAILESIRPGHFLRLWDEARELSNGEEAFISYCQQVCDEAALL